MAKLQMKKIEIITLLKDSSNVVERLQRRGVVELINIEDERLVKFNSDSNIAHIERNITSAESALECLNRTVGYKEPLLSMLGERKSSSTKGLAAKSKKNDEILSACLSILDLTKKINELNSSNAKLAVKADVLRPWENLDIPLSFKGTSTTSAIIGSFTGAVTKEFIEELFSDDENGYPVQAEIISSRKEQTCVLVICTKEDEKEVFSHLREEGFSYLPSLGKKTPGEEIKLIEDEIDKNKEKVLEYEQKICSYDGQRDNIKFLIDYLTLKRDKYKAVKNLAVSNSTVILKGYIPSKYADALVKEFESKYDIAISVTEPDEADDVPVLLENGRFSEPVEGITEMYALPGKRDVDPSSVMAFFYYLFFGMMLSDAGYGLVMFVGTSIILSKFTVEGTLARSLKMFRYCGISTLIWGALFGSWFGDLPQIIASNFFGVTIKTTALWFEPLDDPIKLLLFSFALGIAHLFLGLAVNFKILWSEGKRFDAFCEVVPVYLTVLGVAPLAATILTTVPQIYVSCGKYLMIAGVILIVLTSGRSSKNIILRFFGGLYGLYNIATGYLSDILSYSRLLALGLATGSIAGVINLIATMPQNTVLKAILLIVVGLVGHTANMGINLLGAYVHSDRLQFVELFSKFYEGGGRPFKPLKANTKYIKFEKENIYE